MKQRLLIISTLVIIGFVLGAGLFVPSKFPYRPSYKHIALNIPIAHTHHLSNKTYALGEKYLAESLMTEFNHQGYTASIYTIEDTYSERYPVIGYEFYLRTSPELKHHNIHDLYDNDRIAVLYETIPHQIQEAQYADIVFTGSQKRRDEYRAHGINAYFIPQFTSFDDFYPAYHPDYATDVVYIANQWPNDSPRQSMIYAMQNNIKIDVYGQNWQDILTDKYATWWKGKQIPNNELKYYYSSAKIVLNDMRQDMIDAGFINNRVFDVTACKGFLISSYAQEIAEIYGDTIPMYQTPEEFKKLIEYYLHHPEERQEKAEKAYQITKQYFGRNKVVQEMLKIMESYRMAKQAEEGRYEK